jgi:tetratricopeptide (TPR) repeat protein/KaiC/GvpD/RAD55 family RecA-like ATPase
MATVLWEKIGDKEKAREHQEAALRILEAEPESVELARLYEDIAHMLRRKGEAANAFAWAEKALALAEKLKAAEAVAIACVELSVDRLLLEDPKKAIEYADRALKIALDNNYLETALLAYSRLLDVVPPEEYEKLFEYCEKGLALAKKVGNIEQQSYFIASLAVGNREMGELGKAVTLEEEAIELRKKAGGLTFLPLDLLILGHIYLMLGEWEKSEQYYNEASVAARGKDEIGVNSSILWNFGQLHFDKGEYEKARECFEERVKLWEKNVGRRVGYNVQFLAWTCIELGQLEKAQDLLDGLQKYAHETDMKWALLDEMALRAMLLRAQKEHLESIELFEKTLKEWEFLKANIWEAYWFARWVLCEYARAYVERDQPGDREKAIDLLNRALGMFQKMGAKKDIEKVEAKIAFIETGKAVSKLKPIDHVPTGHPDLDKLLLGGIPSNYAVVLTSSSSDERDLLVKSFLETGAKQGEVTFYVTVDPGVVKSLAEEFPLSLYLFVCNPQVGAIVEEAPNMFRLKGVENLTDISIALTSAIRKLDPSLKGPRRICIGLVSDVLLQHHAVQTRRWLTSIIAELKSMGFTTLAVIDPRMHPSEELYAILGLFDGEISVHEKETEKGPGKFLKIKKMTNQRYLDSELLLRREDL